MPIINKICKNPLCSIIIPHSLDYCSIDCLFIHKELTYAKKEKAILHNENIDYNEIWRKAYPYEAIIYRVELLD